MVEADVVPDEEEGKTSQLASTANTQQVREYAEQMDKIFGDFKDALQEDWKDLPAVMIHALKRHMGKTFYQMKEVNVDTMLKCI